MADRADENAWMSDGHRDLVECRADPVAGGDVGGEFTLLATNPPHEEVASGQDPRGPVGSLGRASAGAASSRRRSVSASLFVYRSTVCRTAGAACPGPEDRPLALRHHRLTAAL